MDKSDFTEKVLQAFTIQNINSEIESVELSEEETQKAMYLYDKVAQVFIDENVDLETSLKVLSAMADAVSFYIVSRPMMDGHFPTRRND